MTGDLEIEIEANTPDPGPTRPAGRRFGRRLAPKPVPDAVPDVVPDVVLDEADLLAPGPEIAPSDEPGDTPPGDDDAPIAVPSAPRSSGWIAWTMAATLAVVAAFAGWQALVATGEVNDLREVQAAAADYVTALSTWDATDGLDDTYLRLRDGASESFVAELDSVFGEQIRIELVAADAISVGTITGVLAGDVLRGTEGLPDRATAVVLVEQLIVTGPNAAPQSQVDRAVLVTLVRDGETWLVTDLEMLSELELIDEESG